MIVLGFNKSPWAHFGYDIYALELRNQLLITELTLNFYKRLVKCVLVSLPLVYIESILLDITGNTFEIER